MKYKYTVITKVYNPKTGEITEEENGPVYSLKTMHSICAALITKRNIISFTTKKESI